MKIIKFKPTFGNEQHIYILDLMGKLNKMQIEYELKKKSMRGAEKLKKDIGILEIKINELIERER